MKEKIMNSINNLHVDSNAKESLQKTYTIANSKNKAIKNNHPIILVTAGEGCGFTSYGMVYKEIIDSANDYLVKGAGTFVDLAFPKDNERDEQMFFSSPNIVARVRNKFCGTMLISLEEFKGQDLLNSDSFERLICYIKDNKTDIHFLIRILPGFTAKNQLIARLKDVTNVMEVNLDKPDIEMSYDYVLSELEARECTVGKVAKTDLKNRVLKSVICSKTFSGYRSLNGLVDRLIYEAAFEMEEDRLVINKKILNKLMESLDEEINMTNTEPVKIGFRT